MHNRKMQQTHEIDLIFKAFFSPFDQPGDASLLEEA